MWQCVFEAATFPSSRQDDNYHPLHGNLPLLSALSIPSRKSAPRQDRGSRLCVTIVTNEGRSYFTARARARVCVCVHARVCGGQGEETWPVGVGVMEVIACFDILRLLSLFTSLMQQQTILMFNIGAGTPKRSQDKYEEGPDFMELWGGGSFRLVCLWFLSMFSFLRISKTFNWVKDESASKQMLKHLHRPLVVSCSIGDKSYPWKFSERTAG